MPTLTTIQFRPQKTAIVANSFPRNNNQNQEKNINREVYDLNNSIEDVEGEISGETSTSGDSLEDKLDDLDILDQQQQQESGNTAKAREHTLKTIEFEKGCVVLHNRQGIRVTNIVWTKGYFKIGMLSCKGESFIKGSPTGKIGMNKLLYSPTTSYYSQSYLFIQLWENMTV